MPKLAVWLIFQRKLSVRLSHLELPLTVFVIRTSYSKCIDRFKLDQSYSTWTVHNIDLPCFLNKRIREK